MYPPDKAGGFIAFSRSTNTLMSRRPSDVLGDPDEIDDASQRVLTQAAGLIGVTATRKFMRSAGSGRNTQTGKGTLRRQTGRLTRSLTGARFDRQAPEGVFNLSPKRGGATLTFGTEVEYAATHEYGDRRAVTSKQEAFFWAKHAETDKDKWKAMALSDTLTYPKRPFLGPALDDVMDDVVEIAEKEMVDVIVPDS